MSAPVPTLDSSGIASWTVGDVTPVNWVIEQCLADGHTLQYYNRSFFLDGTSTSFDCAAIWMAKGMYVVLYGVDVDNNLILLPSISATPLAY
jgi:hypothetical protein